MDGDIEEIIQKLVEVYKAESLSAVEDKGLAREKKASGSLVGPKK